MNSNKTSIPHLRLDNAPFFAEVREMLASGRKVVIRAKGWSMLPLIWDDRDSITLAPLTEASFAIGRVVLAQMGDRRYIVHRIAGIKGERFTLRGDGNPYQYEYCHRDQLVAELVAVCRDGQDIELGSARWRRFQRLWPSNGFLRRACLFIYRRLFVRPWQAKQVGDKG